MLEEGTQHYWYECRKNVGWNMCELALFVLWADEDAHIVI